MPPRLLKLFLGLVAYGVSMVMMLQSDLGLMPWDVLHQALSLQGGWPVGRVTIEVSFAAPLMWIRIRQQPGFGPPVHASVMRRVVALVKGMTGQRPLVGPYGMRG